MTLIDRAQDVAAEPYRSRSSVVSAMFDVLRNGIMRGEFAPNQRLVEADLIRKFGVSRGPVREALSRLAADGLVIMEPHRSAVVRPLTRESLASAFQLRELIEGLAARLAAEGVRRDPSRAEGMRRKLAKLADM